MSGAWRHGGANGSLPGRSSDGLPRDSTNSGAGLDLPVKGLHGGCCGSLEDLEAVQKVLKSALKGDKVLLNPHCKRSQQDKKEEDLAKLFREAGYF